MDSKLAARGFNVGSPGASGNIRQLRSSGATPDDVLRVAEDLPQLTRKQPYFVTPRIKFWRQAQRPSDAPHRNTNNLLRVPKPDEEEEITTEAETGDLAV